jgi:glucokinase
MKKIAIGTDIGGSHISCAAIDLEKKLIIKKSIASQAVDHQASADAILDNWATALKRSIAAIDASQLAGIGFAMPGPFNYEKGIALFTPAVAKFQNLYGLNISQRLNSLLAGESDYPMRYLNDATAFAVGEAWLGQAAGVKRSMAITLGTGFGSAFVDDGIPVVDRNDVPPMGCVWHLPFNGAIADESFSTRWFIKQYAARSGHQATGVKEIADQVTTDPVARGVFMEFGTNLGTFLAPWLKKFNAETLVIGGNVAAAYPSFGKALETSLANQKCPIPIHISVLKEDAALIGSARLFDENFWPRVKPLLARM